jgi:hypothetical protein
MAPTAEVASGHRTWSTLPTPPSSALTTNNNQITGASFLGAAGLDWSRLEAPGAVGLSQVRSPAIVIQGRWRPPTDYLMSPSRLRDIAGAPAQWGAAAARICCAVPCRSRHRCSTHIGARCSPMGLNLKPTLSLVGRDAANQNAAAS